MPENLSMDDLIEQINKINIEASFKPPEAEKVNDSVDNSDSAKTVAYVNEVTISAKGSASAFNIERKKETKTSGTTQKTSSYSPYSTSSYSGTSWGSGYGFSTAVKKEETIFDKAKKDVDNAFLEFSSQFIEDTDGRSIFDILESKKLPKQQKDAALARAHSNMIKIEASKGVMSAFVGALRSMKEE